MTLIEIRVGEMTLEERKRTGVIATLSEAEKLSMALDLIDLTRNTGFSNMTYRELIETLEKGNLDAVVKWLAL